ncbi:uncharacterized protein METZ01_LOCUS44862 [marine metagenome]|uniref:DUF1343 domain-containing protein n=1 Tax=marine metagenome TaxID=408172 RepID=A0A381RM32_9ZZZZ|tara:strand:- start:2247 stop:3449 length:1203 start_codon:yes stop_codon:yes gene_type:complete
MIQISQLMKLNIIKFKSTFFLILISFSYLSFSQNNDKLTLGADQIDFFIDDLKGKNVAIVANQTSKIKSDNRHVHIIDSLLSLNINIKKVFSPEHGFRGIADAGEKVEDGIDLKTGLPIISLHGSNKKPTINQMKDLDVVIFDIQDVGVRFYTYISTLHLVMEAVAENNKKLIILDRPNPNGHYIDGPILENNFKSFVGMHPIPIVHGMTIGELGIMINKEGWLKNKINCDLKVIPIENYDRNIIYDLPEKPSPNLPNKKSINLYPSLCLFEQTPISIGRGTEMQFQIIGNPDWKKTNFNFRPKSMSGAKSPKHLNKICNGIDLRNYPLLSEINLEWIIYAYNKSKNKASFFRSGFNRLAGNDKLKEQIINGLSEKEIKLSWKKGIEDFKSIRSKYLLYN